MSEKLQGSEAAPQKNQIVYIRALRDEERPDGAPDTVYAIHDAAGQRLGLAPDRETAFFAARSHDLAPVSVH